MMSIMQVTLRGIYRDRIFQGIMVLAVLFLFVPATAALSMRQVTELATTLSLSLISFIMLLLAVFLGATSIWKDFERRYTYSTLSLPVHRISFVFGRFLGIALFMIVMACTLGCLALLAIKVAAYGYPPSRRILWDTIILSILFDTFKYIVVVAIAMLLATISTSFFLPVFGAICIFIAGTITQPVFDYLQTSSAQANVSATVQGAAKVFYYILPNLSGFDLKVNAIYSIPADYHGLLLTSVYFAIYSCIVMSIAAILFTQREVK